MDGYILERTGWAQWLDDGDVWRSLVTAARVFPTRAEAEAKAAALEVELGDDSVTVTEVGTI